MVSFFSAPECGAQSTPVQEDKQYLVVDFGAGTFDTSFVRLQKNKVTCISEPIKCFTGGEDIDKILC